MKPISKVNENIYSLINRINELHDYNPKDDFSTRENKICANIKVYEWLDEQDVLNTCESLGITKTKKILKEFDENRMNSIHDHVCENEVSYLKEKYEDNCDISNYDYILRVGRIALSEPDKQEEYKASLPKLKYYIENYWDKAISFKSFEEYKKSIIENSCGDFAEWEKRKQITFEVWQYGRSGGWLSICDVNELNFEELDCDYFGWSDREYLEAAYRNDDNKAFNDALAYAGYEVKDKKKLIKDLEELIKDAENKIDVVRYFVNTIEESKKYFKECLITQLEYEIQEFVGVNLKESNVVVRIEEDKVKTSLGVSVVLEEFKTLFNKFAPILESLERKQKVDINVKVGNYLVEWAKKKKDDVIIKAGCHRFSYNQLKAVMS